MDSLKVDPAGLVSIPKPLVTLCQCPTIVANWKLSDEVLMEIFRYCLRTSSPSWPTLGHICRRWRRIVFACFRLYFSHGIPVSKTLDRWPALPIVVEYGGSPALNPPAPTDEDHIMAALNQSDRVSSISLTVTSSFLERLSTIERPFSELEDLVLWSPNGRWPTLPSAFVCGTRLRRLRLTRIILPSLPRLLYSSRKLVDLQLHEVITPLPFSLETLADALSEMDQLRSLSLHLFITTNSIGASLPSRLGKRVVLPALTRFSFLGIADYLEDLLAEIDAPHLGDIEVAFYHRMKEHIPSLSKLSEFINRIGMHESHRRVNILSSESAISISLVQPRAPMRLKMQLFCMPLISQLDIMAHMCSQISILLLNVEDLRIIVTRPSSGQADNNSEQWQRLILHFGGTKSIYVAGPQDYSMTIVRALELSEGRETLLPALHKLRIQEPETRHAPFRQAAVSLMASRRLSGRLIVEYERLWINDLGGTGHVSQHVTIEMLVEMRWTRKCNRMRLL